MLPARHCQTARLRTEVRQEPIGLGSLQTRQCLRRVSGVRGRISAVAEPAFLAASGEFGFLVSYFGRRAD